MNNLAEMRALETRKSLGLASHEAVDIFKVLHEIEGISLAFMEMSEKMSGLFVRKGRAALIVVNSKKTLGHQRFTAAHEYYHYKYSKGAVSRICPIKKFAEDNPEEREANIFAINFLLPEEGVKYMFYKRTEGKTPDISDIIFLEQYFGVSHQFMLIRLKELNLITEKQEKDFSKDVIKKAREYGYSTQLYKNTSGKEIQVYSPYAELAKKLLDAGRISYGKYEELLIEGGYAHLIFEPEEDTEGEINELEDAYSL
ncbi:ImmA/IrrE family metallo-endopeptidase [Caldicellulosiruptor sp. DIB 104C]|uniref:ImmA/IrrE family metallo-endopeptidase n=1 Tax=Caldicellulosiruptor sp. DIB 104C TaxID=3019889 RepID=UPI002305FA77|nr:ImmA/IrrE family metallo-endopeptidase [Caldicellulosiruptor sp. DIB 104C]